MILCYYIENGKIIECHDNRGKTYDELKTMANEWNSKNNKQVHIVKVEEDSLIAYLYAKLKEKQELDKQTILDIEDSLCDALNAIRCLL